MKWFTRIAALLAAVAAQCVSPYAAAQAYPVKPVRVIIPYPAGGGADAAARLAADGLARALGQSFIVEQRPGGNTLIGTEAAVKSVPDGYTLLLTGGSTMSVQPFVFAGTLPYDPVDGFAHIGSVSRFPFIVTVPASLPPKTLPEFIAYVKAHKGEFSYGSNGTGALAHLGIERLNTSTGLQITHVPYKGFGPMMPDLLSGRVIMTMADLAPIAGHLKAGTLRALAVTTKERWSQMPELPTVAESGLPGYEVDVWFGLFAPAKTPPEIVSRLSAELQRYLASAEAKEAFLKIGHEASPSTGDAVRQRIIAEQKVYSALVKQIGLKPE
jgi:tripartite-type tricarboxylate transporter receptor subunit TctC